MSSKDACPALTNTDITSDRCQKLTASGTDPPAPSYNQKLWMRS